MRHALKLHPDSHCVAVTGIDVDVERPSRGNLVLRYVVTGAIGDVRIPPVATPARTDELWKHTCFEAFVRPSKGAEYFEFNFAPSTQWAAYRFSGYRVGMSSAREISASPMEVLSGDTQFELQVSPDLDRLPGLSGYADWRLGLSAVIEETSGNKSYWALAHPPGKADFHHSDCFALRLPAAERS
jgi:hypothetical protein